MVLADRRVARAALRIANQTMRVEVLPQLATRHPRPNSWNPLRIANGPGYAMKLWMPDKLAMEILRNQALMAQTADIVVSAVRTAALEREPKAFVTSVLESLIND